MYGIARKNIGINYHDYDYRCVLANEEKYLKSKSFIRDTEYWQQVISEYDGQNLPFQNDSEDWEGRRKKVGLSPENTKSMKQICIGNNISIPCFFMQFLLF